MMRANSPVHVLPFILLLLVAKVEAQEIFLQKDSQGRTIYSSSPKDQESPIAELPKLGREDLDKRIAEIKANTIPSCEKHGGVDCSLGADIDGSVICLDGERGARLPYRFACMESKLSARFSARLETSLDAPEPEEQSISKLRTTLKPREKVSSLHAEVRNTTAVKAFGIRVQLKLPGDPTRYLFEGPREIDAFGLAYYNFSLPKAMSRFELERANLSAHCTNCP